jgi:hypothetical protein
MTKRCALCRTHPIVVYPRAVGMAYWQCACHGDAAVLPLPTPARRRSYFFQVVADLNPDRFMYDMLVLASGGGHWDWGLTPAVPGGAHGQRVM